jgi:hypothetical protein
VLEAYPDSRELALALSGASQLAMLAERTDEAIALGDRAIELGRRIGDRETVVHAQTNVGTAMLGTPRHDEGRALLEQAHVLAAEADYEDHAARALVNLATTTMLRRREDPRISADLERALAYARPRGLDAYVQYLLGGRANVRLRAGEWVGAEADAREAAEAEAEQVREARLAEAEAEAVRRGARSEAEAIRAAVQAEAENSRRQVELEVSTALLDARRQAERDAVDITENARTLKQDVERRETRLAEREERLDAETRRVEQRDRELATLERDLAERAAELDARAAEHRLLFEAVRDGDRESAAELMRRHVETSLGARSLERLTPDRPR